MPRLLMARATTTGYKNRRIPRIVNDLRLETGEQLELVS
jgi:hypothetical protein